MLKPITTQCTPMGIDSNLRLFMGDEFTKAEWPFSDPFIYISQNILYVNDLNQRLNSFTQRLIEKNDQIKFFDLLLITSFLNIF